MTYVFDTSSFIVLGHYYKELFPSLWKSLNKEVQTNNIISVREVFNELESYGSETDIKKWVRENKKIFQLMTKEESQIMSSIFKDYPKYQNMINKKALSLGRPVADPFIVAKAEYVNGTVVSEESFQKMALKYQIYVKLKIFPA